MKNFFWRITAIGPVRVGSRVAVGCLYATCAEAGPEATRHAR